jgi:hypothetical protein
VQGLARRIAFHDKRPRPIGHSQRQRLGDTPLELFHRTLCRWRHRKRTPRHALHRIHQRCVQLVQPPNLPTECASRTDETAHLPLGPDLAHIDDRRNLLFKRFAASTGYVDAAKTNFPAQQLNVRAPLE